MARLYLLRTLEVADAMREAENAQASTFFNEHYHEYVKAHGHHFTNDLAEYACRKMHNANDTQHSWSCEDVLVALASQGISIPPTSTIGDMTYSANMAYADFFPLVIKDIPSCVLYARAVATDPDGYEGIQFYRWLADLMATDTHIDWKRFI